MCILSPRVYFHTSLNCPFSLLFRHPAVLPPYFFSGILKLSHRFFPGVPQLIGKPFSMRSVPRLHEISIAAEHRLGTNVWVRRFNDGLLTRSQFASGRSWGRPNRSGFSVVFFGPRINAELVPKFHVALHASHAAFPMVTLKISPCNNVTLTFHFDYWLWPFTLTLGWITLFKGDMGEGALHREDEVTVKQIN
jgi:hypothetical protein